MPIPAIMLVTITAIQSLNLDMATISRSLKTWKKVSRASLSRGSQAPFRPF
jgi:hypothetical protein